MRGRALPLIWSAMRSAFRRHCRVLRLPVGPIAWPSPPTPATARPTRRANYSCGKCSLGRAIRTIDTGVSPRWMGLVEDANAVVAANRNQLFAWNYNTGKKILEVTDVHGRFIDFLAAAPLKGSHMVTAGGDQNLYVWDLTTGKRLAEWRMDQRADGLAMSRDGKFAITWHNGANTIGLWGIPDSVTKKAAAIPRDKLLSISIAKVATAVSTKGLFDREDAQDQRLSARRLEARDGGRCSVCSRRPQGRQGAQHNSASKPKGYGCQQDAQVRVCAL